MRRGSTPNTETNVGMLWMFEDLVISSCVVAQTVSLRWFIAHQLESFRYQRKLTVCVTGESFALTVRRFCRAALESEGRYCVLGRMRCTRREVDRRAQRPAQNYSCFQNPGCADLHLIDFPETPRSATVDDSGKCSHPRAEAERSDRGIRKKRLVA